jgi:hypothetical protein
MLSIHLRLGLPSGLFPSGFPTNNLYTVEVHFCKIQINVVLPPDRSFKWPFILLSWSLNLLSSPLNYLPSYCPCLYFITWKIFRDVLLVQEYCILNSPVMACISYSLPVSQKSLLIKVNAFCVEGNIGVVINMWRTASEARSRRNNKQPEQSCFPQVIIHNKWWGAPLPRPLLLLSDISRAMSRRALHYMLTVAPAASLSEPFFTTHVLFRLSAPLLCTAYIFKKSDSLYHSA